MPAELYHQRRICGPDSRGQSGQGRTVRVASDGFNVDAAFRHMEAASGNLEVVDAPGNLIVRTRDEDITIENAGGKVKIEDRNGNIQVRFSSPRRTILKSPMLLRRLL